MDHVYQGVIITKKILVTGSTVFVSRFVANYFAQKGDDVYAGTEGGDKRTDPLSSPLLPTFGMVGVNVVLTLITEFVFLRLIIKQPAKKPSVKIVK